MDPGEEAAGDQARAEEMCDRLLERVKRMARKYRELKVNNEEF